MNRLFVGGLLVAACLLAAVQSWAIYLHNFSCNNCHAAGVSLYATGNSNLCVQCHRSGTVGITTNDGRTGPATMFSENDLSNAMGTHTSIDPSEQTSHSWVAMRDVVPAAGATRATTALYYSRYGASNGKLTCTKCHNPHANYSGTSNPGDNTALRMDNSTDGVCLDCHRDWNKAPADALETHPVGVALAGTSVKGSISNPEVQLVGGAVSCSSCHNVHWTDSNGATTDGRGGNHATGDGKLLVTDGRGMSANTLCQACHTYQAHGGGQIGCLDCHSGHSYNNGSPNYYVLRSEISNVWNAKGGSLNQADVGGLNYTSTTAMWKNGGSGYCEGCHDLGADHNGFTIGSASPAECGSCHKHDDSTAAFTGACNTCHGYAPNTNSQGDDTTGYAYAMVDHDRDGGTPDVLSDYSLSSNPKIESGTPHINHSDPLDPDGGRGNHNLSCQQCHADLSTTHKNAQFQDVVFGAIADTGTTATYAPSGNGTCATVYCHSNGNGGSYDAVSWGGARRSGATDCTLCHGNTAAAMSTAGNTATHNKHLNRYTNNCGICHQSTASDNATLVRGGSNSVVSDLHVNGSADVYFDSSFDLGSGTLGTPGAYDGSCSAVYCHSNGKGNYAAADWATPASGACGTCHQVNASGDSGTALGGSHPRHVFDADGPQLSCDSCHGSNAASGTHTGHVDGGITLLGVSACNACHGIEGTDPSPVWGDADTDDCVTCHTGTALSSVNVAAPDKSNHLALGHGKTGLSGAPSCDGCHDAAAPGHFDGDLLDTRLKDDPNGDTTDTPYTTDASLWCQECHAQQNHFDDTHEPAGTSSDGNACAICHDHHGEGMGSNSDAMLVIGSGFTDRSQASSYYNGSNTGVCQVCHSPASLSHYNTAGNDGHNSGTACISCHSHGTVPSFKASCNGCHGDATTTQFWPDGDNETQIPTANDQVGRHDAHMAVLAERVYGETATGAADNDILRNFTTLNPAMSSDQKQIALCAYCHAATTNDDDHGDVANLPVEVFSATVGGTANTQVSKAMWGAADAAPLAAYDAGADTCSNVDCHNNTLTADGTYGWYDSGTSSCTMCHIVDPTSDNTHLDHTGSSATYGRTIVCTDCHNAVTWGSSAPSSGHIDGSWTIVGPSYDGNSVNKAKGSCGTNSCHNDGTGSGAPSRGYTWGGTLADDCGSCHLASPTADKHAEHLGNTNYVTGSCATCHTAANTSNHLNGVANMANKVGSMDSGNQSCTNSCHLAGTGDWAPAGVLVCADCHNADGNVADLGSYDLDQGDWPPSSNAHGTHVGPGTSAAYGDTGTYSTVAAYEFGCGNCHGTTVAAHMDGSATITGNGWNGTAKTCNNTYCHSTGKEVLAGGDYATTPAWTATLPADGDVEDRCAQCHGNSPDTGGHMEHVIGFHYDRIYSGMKDFLPVKDADPVPFGLTYTDKDEIRGHGSKLADGTTSTSTVMNCNVCHASTVTAKYNAKHLNTVTAKHSCSTTDCHAAVASPTATDKAVGNAAAEIADKRFHVNGTRDVVFFNEIVRSKAQVRDDLLDVSEIANNWARVNGYKAADGSSYDVQPDTLANLASSMGGWTTTDVTVYAGQPEEMTQPARTCLISCHLWEAGRVDKSPVHWEDNAHDGSAPLMCIDCHTRLPK